MGIPRGGKNYRLVGEQSRRISACRLTFLIEMPGAELRQNGAFVQNAITLTADADDDRQRALWQECVRLDDGFWRSLRDHPVPVREEAVRAIGARSLALALAVYPQARVDPDPAGLLLHPFPRPRRGPGRGASGTADPIRTPPTPRPCRGTARFGLCRHGPAGRRRFPSFRGPRRRPCGSRRSDSDSTDPPGGVRAAGSGRGRCDFPAVRCGNDRQDGGTSLLWRGA